MSRQARLKGDSLAGEANQDPRRRPSLRWPQAPRNVHFGSCTHPTAPTGINVRDGPRAPTVRRARPPAPTHAAAVPLAPRTARSTVSTQPNHVFEGQLRPTREQLAVPKAPVRHDGDFHLPAGSTIDATGPVARTHSAADYPSASRTPPSSTEGALRAHGQSPSTHDRVLPVGREAGPIQRNDHFGGAATMNGVQYAKKAQTSTPRLRSSRSTCFTRRRRHNVPMAWAKPRPTAWIASEALVSTPWVALANDSTRLACRSPSYKVVMKFRMSCLRSHCRDEAGRS